jgi:hypothetical protein
MGMPGPEAMVAGRAALFSPSLEAPEICARAAFHEGRCAQIAGRVAEAVRWWNATIDFGCLAQSAAETMAEFQMGRTVETIGASPAWRWYHSSATHVPGGRLMGGRFFFGPHHDFYAEQVGESADAALRDQLIQSMARTMTLRQLKARVSHTAWYGKAGEMLIFGQAAVAFVAAALLVLAVLGVWRSGAAEVAVSPPSLWQAAASIPSILVLALGAGVAVALARPGPASSLLAPSAGPVAVTVAAGLLIALLLPFALALPTRRQAGSLISAWRCTAKRVLAITIVLAALLYLGTGIAAMHLRARFTRQWTWPGVSEMDRVERFGGARWQDPPIPPDSWRAEYPPL